MKIFLDKQAKVIMMSKMGMTDPIADMLTRLRNAIQSEHREVELPASLIKLGIADVLKREGYIKDSKLNKDNKQGIMKIYLKSKPVIQGLKRISKPGRRVYVEAKNIPMVQDGIGIAVLSTSKGILSSREAKLAKIGGEVLAHIW